MRVAPTLSADLADAAGGALAGHTGGWAPLAAGLRALERLAATPAEADLRSWAARIATPDGAVPLPGTGLRAAPYPALLWAGERTARAGLGDAAQLALVGLVAGAEHGCSAADVSRAVHAGRTVADLLRQRTAAVARPVALPTGGVVPAAVCAAVLGGVPLDDLAAVLDLAGSLMAITAPDPGAAPWAGHAGAAGWLAVRSRAAGLVGMPDGLGHTLAAVTGPAPGDDLLDRAAGEVGAGALLARLR